MKVYTCTAFSGHWPVGTAAVVVAESPEEAAVYLERVLTTKGLSQRIDAGELVPLDVTHAGATILNDGDY